MTVTAGTGQLTVKADQGTAPATVPLDSSKTLNRFWSLSGSGITASLKFSYQQADVFGNEANYKLIRVAGGVAIPSANGTPCPGAGSPCVDTTANTIFVAGVTSFAPYYTAGELTPTAAAVGIAGRAVDASGRGIPRALVTITDDAGNTFMTITNPFGYYSFPNLTAGQTYVIAASHKQFHFDARAVSLNDGVSGFDLIGKP